MTGQSLVDLYQEVWAKFIKSEINTGTDNNDDKLLDRGFVFQFDEKITDVDVLFVGINPSYSGIPEQSKFYTREQSLQHKYFKPFENIKNELSSNYNREIVWSHTDLLVFRETKQEFIKNSVLKSSEGVDFVWKQLEISKEILEYINPKIIVVSNTQARTFLGADKYVAKGKEHNSWMNYEFTFDVELGTRKIINNNQFEPYVFFTSMLSGQRALDNGSKERLVWHIDQVLKKVSNS